MYTQQIRTQCPGVSSTRRMLAPSVSRTLVGRSTGPQCLRPAFRRSTMKTRAVVEKMQKAPAKRDLPTKGLDYKPKDNGNAVQTDIVKKLAYVVGADAHAVSDREAYQGVALSVRERLIERFNKTQEHWRCAADRSRLDSLHKLCNTAFRQPILCEHVDLLWQAEGPQVCVLPVSRVSDGPVLAQHSLELGPGAGVRRSCQAARIQPGGAGGC